MLALLFKGSYFNSFMICQMDIKQFKSGTLNQVILTIYVCAKTAIISVKITISKVLFKQFKILLKQQSNAQFQHFRRVELAPSFLVSDTLSIVILAVFDMPYKQPKI